MSRIQAGAAGSAVLYGGPGTARQGAPGVAPRPSSSTEGAVQHAAVRRAKAIAAGLFVALVLVHAGKGE